jgi:hypothetical protein
MLSQMHQHYQLNHLIWLAKQDSFDRIFTIQVPTSFAVLQTSLLCHNADSHIQRLPAAIKKA